MSIDAVSNSSSSAVAAAQNQAQNTTQKAEEKKNTSSSASTATTPSTPASVYTKSNDGIDRAEVDRLLKESKTANDSIAKLLMDVMQKQGKKYNQAWGLMDYSFIDPEMRAAAQKDIAEDGYFGVKATSERILDFAKALSGGNPDAIPGLRDAIEKGFAAAEKAWGTELPDISKQTMEAVRAGLDEWEQSFNTVEEE